MLQHLVGASVFMILLGATGVQAATSGETITKKLDELNGERARLEKSIRDYESRMAEIEGAFETAQKAMEERGGFFSFASKEEKKRLEAAYREARAQKANCDRELRPRLRVARSQLAAVETDIDGAFSQYTRAESDQQDRERMLRIKVREQGLEIDLLTLRGMMDSGDASLDFIERVYDKTLVGAYFQDKIGQLLNSQVICEARKRCSSSEAMPIRPETIRKELFPETDVVRSEYYNKVNKKAAGDEAK